MLRLTAEGLARRLHFVTTYLADLKEQYGDAPGLSMVSDVLATLGHHDRPMARPGSAHDPDPTTDGGHHRHEYQVAGGRWRVAGGGWTGSEDGACRPGAGEMRSTSSTPISETHRAVPASRSSSATN